MKQTPRGELGFTLVELMVVIAIVAVVAALGFSRMTGFTASEDARRFTREIASQITAARRRAINSGLTYEIHLKQRSVQWVRKNAGNAIVEYGPLVQAGGAPVPSAGAKPLSILGVRPTTYAQLASTSSVINTQHTPSTVFTASTTWIMQVDGTGIVDGDVTNNGSSPPPLDGLSIFVDGPRKFRVIVYPLAAQPQVLDRW